ncbi:LysR family transcriptional regulator [Vibrio sp. WXL210]|uniref:LysR family transcriptional regulator n=1 Tax=Vibrio sp. WXL210 TaxID=3450709 RepID=UPI003EC4CEA2
MALDFDLNLLTVFNAVYRHGSITLAAEELDMTQPGVSGLLKRLQTKLKVQLFVRDGRGIAPTQQAHELHRHTEPALVQINNALEGLGGFSTQRKHKFVIYASEPMMLILLPKIESDPSLGQVTIELHPSRASHEQLLHNLNLQRADLAVDFVNQSASSFVSQPLYDDQMCVIARRGHPRVKQTLSLAQYYQERHITLSKRREDTHLASYYVQGELSERIVAAEAESLMSQMTMVASSDCLAVTAKSVASLFVDKLELQLLEPPFNCSPIQFGLLSHKRMSQNPANQWLRDKLQSYFSH